MEEVPLAKDAGGTDSPRVDSTVGVSRVEFLGLKQQMQRPPPRVGANAQVRPEVLWAVVLARGGGQRAERVCAHVCTNVPLSSVPVCVRTYCWGGSESHPGSCCFRVHIRTAGSGHVGEGEERAGDKAGKVEANQRGEPGPPTPASGLHLAGTGIHWPTGLSRGKAGHVPCIVCGPPWAGGAQALSEDAGGRE